MTWVTVRAGIDRCRLRRGCPGLRPVGEKRQLSDSASPWRSVGATGLKFGFKLSWWFVAEHRTTSAIGVAVSMNAPFWRLADVVTTFRACGFSPPGPS